MKLYVNQPSFVKIKNSFFDIHLFDFPEVRIDDINAIINSLSPNRATGPDLIPLKIIKTTASITYTHLKSIINKILKANKYMNRAKTAIVRPILKNYRLVNILNDFSKIYERFLHDRLTKFTLKIFSYGTHHSSSHVLLKLTEEWENL